MAKEGTYTVTRAADRANSGGGFGNEPTPIGVVTKPTTTPTSSVSPAPGVTRAGSGWAGTEWEGYVSPTSAGYQRGDKSPVQLAAEQAAKEEQLAKEKSKIPILPSYLQGSTGYDPYANIQGITREEYLASRRADDQYTGIRRAAPITAGIYEWGAGVSEGLTSGWNQITGYSETSHPIKKAFVGAGYLITGLPSLAGQAAVVGEFGLRHPAELPTALRKGLPLFGGQITEQAKTHPWETAGMVAGMIAGPKIVKSVGERLPAVKLRAIEQPSAQGFIDNVAAKQPITQWKPSTTNPVWTQGKGWSVLPESTKTPITQWKPSTTNPVWTPGKGWSGAVPVAAGMTYQGLSVEHGRKAQPIIGITDVPVTNKASVQVFGKSIVAGTPKFKPEAVQDIFKSQFSSKIGYMNFETPTEYAIATKNILPTYEAPTRELFEATIAKRQLTFGVKSTHALGDVPLEDVFTRHELKVETGKNLRSYMQSQKDLIIWGSTANKAQVMGKGGVGYFREIHDIDLHVRNPLQTSQEMFNIISKTEKPGFVTMKSGGLETAKGTLFDIKTIEGGLPEEWALSGPEISQPKEGNIFLFSSEKPGKIGKFQVQSLSSQATSKLSSIAFRGKTVSAHPWRAGKDPFDLVYVNEPSLTMDIGKSWNPVKRFVIAPKAKALDIKIGALTEAKIKAQPIGELPGQISLEQKNLFFENLAAMRAGKAVVTLPSREMLYRAKTPAYGKPLTSGMLAGMVSGGGRISVGSLSTSMVTKRTARHAGISSDISRQITKSARRSGYYPSPSPKVKRSGIGSMSFSSPKIISPKISLPRSHGRTPPYHPPSTPPNYDKFKIKMPKIKIPTSMTKRVSAKFYGKFPERARVASAGRVMGMKGFKFPWEEEKKHKSKSGKGRRRK